MAGVPNAYKLTDAALSLDRGPVDQRQDEEWYEPAHIGFTRKGC